MELDSASTGILSTATDSALSTKALSRPFGLFAIIILQWIEFALFSFFSTALYVNTLSPQQHLLADKWIFISLMISLACFPLGGLIFGLIGDSVKRETATKYSVIILGVATVAIGLLPSFHTLGLLAFILLFMFRGLQCATITSNFCGTAIIYHESASKKFPYLHVSFVGSAISVGLFVSTFFVFYTRHMDAGNWIWRLPFLLGIVSIILSSSVFRIQKTETETKNKISISPLIKLFRFHKTAMLQVFALASFIIVQLGMSHLFYLYFLIHYSNVANDTALILAGFSSLCLIGLFPIMALMADKIGSHTIRQIGFAGVIITTPMLFMIIQLDSLVILIVAEIFLAVFTASAIAPLLKHCLDRFPKDVRFSGLALSFSLSFVGFGATLFIFSDYLINKVHLLYGPSLYASLIALIAFLVTLGNEFQPKMATFRHGRKNPRKH